MKTKKLLYAAFAALILSSPAIMSAQDNNSGSSTIFGKGSNVISLGLGIGGEYTYFGDGYSSTPNFVITYDNGTFGNVGPGTISLGGLFSYKGISYDYTDFHTGYNYDQSWYYYIIGIRSAYHLSLPSVPRLDLYAGLMLAYYDVGFRESSNDPFYNNPNDIYYGYNVNNYNSYLALSLYVGVRYFVTNHFGFWLELGYGYSNAALGISFKL